MKQGKALMIARMAEQLRFGNLMTITKRNIGNNRLLHTEKNGVLDRDEMKVK